MHYLRFLFFLCPLLEVVEFLSVTVCWVKLILLCFVSFRSLEISCLLVTSRHILLLELYQFLDFSCGQFIVEYFFFEVAVFQKVLVVIFLKYLEQLVCCNLVCIP